MLIIELLLDVPKYRFYWTGCQVIFARLFGMICFAPHPTTILYLPPIYATMHKAPQILYIPALQYERGNPLWDGGA